MYKTLAGNVTNLSCDTPNNQQLYFRKEAFRAETSRRSLTISDLPLHNTAVLCTAEGITGKRLQLLVCVVHVFSFLFVSTPVITTPPKLYSYTCIYIHVQLCNGLQCVFCEQYRNGVN